jgi:hypothetical protein
MNTATGSNWEVCCTNTYSNAGTRKCFHFLQWHSTLIDSLVTKQCFNSGFHTVQLSSRYTKQCICHILCQSKTLFLNSRQWKKSKYLNLRNMKWVRNFACHITRCLMLHNGVVRIVKCLWCAGHVGRMDRQTMHTCRIAWLETLLWKSHFGYQERDWRSVELS